MLGNFLHTIHGKILNFKSQKQLESGNKKRMVPVPSPAAILARNNSNVYNMKI